jgi:formate/nitrite transporter FocA (FNT family)
MSHKTRAIIVGIAAGALLGAAFAWIAGDDAGEESGESNPLAHLGPGDYFTLGISILTLARQFGGMLKRV